MAKKQNKRVNGKAKQREAKLPAGYTAIAVGGGFGAWHDFNKASVLQGKVSGIDSITTTDDDGKKVKRRVIRVETVQGVTVSVGESFALKELFDTPKLKGKSVYIEFLGQKSFKNKQGKARKINQFAVGVK